MARWAGIFRETARQHALLDFQAELIEPRSRYLSVLLKSARLTDVRRGLERFYGVVHSVLRVPTDDGPAEFSAVVAPQQLANVKAGRLDRVIHADHRLLGPVPYIGGAIDAQVGLLSVPSSELVEPYLSLLRKLGEQAVVPFFSIAKPFVEPLVQGVNLLAGGGRGTNVEIGLDTSWPQVRAGYVVAVRATRDDAQRRGLTLGPDNASVMDGAGAPIDEPYLILEIRADERRPDWPSIPELATAYGRVRETYRHSGRAELNRTLDDFSRTALTCVDLLPHDRIAAKNCVEEEVRGRGVPARQARDGVERDDPGLRPLDQLVLYPDRPGDS
jgi:hypothetical protein